MSDPQRKPWTLERVMVVASPLPYASPLLFKVGQAQFFKIPFDVLSIKVTDLVRQGVALAFLGLYALILIGILLADRGPRWLPSPSATSRRPACSCSSCLPSRSSRC